MLTWANDVAPHTGAWIETVSVAITFVSIASPLTQGRGLKPIARFVDEKTVLSPLTQGRGLKRFNQSAAYPIEWSPLTQGRGLKLQIL